MKTIYCDAWYMLNELIILGVFLTKWFAAIHCSAALSSFFSGGLQEM